MKKFTVLALCSFLIASLAHATSQDYSLDGVICTEDTLGEHYLELEFTDNGNTLEMREYNINQLISEARFQVEDIQNRDVSYCVKAIEETFGNTYQQLDLQLVTLAGSNSQLKITTLNINEVIGEESITLTCQFN